MQLYITLTNAMQSLLIRSPSGQQEYLLKSFHSTHNFLYFFNPASFKNTFEVNYFIKRNSVFHLVVLWNIHPGEDGWRDEERRVPLHPLAPHQPVEEHLGVDRYLIRDRQI